MAQTKDRSLDLAKRALRSAGGNKERAAQLLRMWQPEKSAAAIAQLDNVKQD